MNASAETPGAAWRKHGTEPMPHSDGPETTRSEIQDLVQAQREQSACIGLLAEAIDRLAASNEVLVESLMAEVEQGDDEEKPQRYMDGTMVS